MCGVFVINTSKILTYEDHSAIHCEYQPHEWVVSWTTTRSHDDTAGNAFYLAQYAICVANSANTLIAFMPKDFHGTSLPLYNPLDANPSFTQRGLAIATPSRLRKTWNDYKTGKMTEAAAIASLYGDHDIKYT
jgi:hypothetical protein